MRWTHVVAVAGLLSSASASAQVVSPTSYCAGGVTGLCFSLKFDFAPNLLTIYLRNLEGTGIGGQYTGINQLFIYRDNTLGPGTPEENELVVGGWNPLGSIVGNVAVGPSTSVDRDDCSVADCTDAYFQYQQFGIIGCSPNENDVLWAFQTCARKGFDGWVRYDFPMYVTRPGEDHGIAFDDFTFGLGGDGYDCRYVGGRIVTPASCAVVDAFVSPEPSTLALVAPAVLLIGWRRRSRRTASRTMAAP